MAIDDEVIREARAARSSQGSSGWAKVHDLVLSADPDKVIAAFDRLCRLPSPGSALVDYARALVSSLGALARIADDAAEKGAALLLRVVLKILELIHTGRVASDRYMADCLTVVSQEVQFLDPSGLAAVVSSIAKNLEREENGEEDQFLTLELLPVCLGPIPRCTDRSIPWGEDGDEELVAGEAFVERFVEKIVGLTWSNALVVKLAALMRELPLEARHLERLIDKVLSGMQQLDLQDLPGVVHQLLLAALKGSKLKRVALVGIIEFFGGDGGGGSSGKSSGDVWDQVVGTSILHVSFAVKQDPGLGQELLKLMRSSSRLISPFLVSVLFSIGRMQRFEQSALELIRSSVMTAYRNSEQCRCSKWAFSIGGDECKHRSEKIRISLLRSVESNAFGSEYMAPSIVKVGFLLIETRSIKSPFGNEFDPATWCRSLGVEMLVTAFKSLSFARDEIIDQCKCLIIGLKQHRHDHPAFSLLSTLIASNPSLMLDHVNRLKECLDYFTFLHAITARAYIQTISPLFRISRDLQDYTLLALRKAMFSRDAILRTTAAYGLMQLITVACGESKSQPGNGAGCSQSSQRERRSDGGLTLLKELFGLLRRCLSQQASVREVLYCYLPRLLQANAGAANMISSLLWPHFNQFFDNVEENKVGIKLNACVTIKNDAAELIEPIDHLLYCVHRSIVLCPREDERRSSYAWTSLGLSQEQSEFTDNSSKKSLSNALQALQGTVGSTFLDNMDLKDVYSATPDRMQKLEHARLVLGVLEVLISIASSETLENRQKMEQIRTWARLHNSLSDQLERKPAKARSSSDASKSIDVPVPMSAAAVLPQLDLEKRKPLLSISCVDFLLQSSRADPTGNSDELLRFSLGSLLRLLLTDAKSERFDSDSLGDGDDLAGIGPTLFGILLALEPARSTSQTSKEKEKVKEKSTKGKKSKKVNVNNLMLLGSRVADSLVKVAARSNGLRKLLKAIVSDAADDDDYDEHELITKFLAERIEPLMISMHSASRFVELEVMAGTMLFLGSRLPPELTKSHWITTESFCKEQITSIASVARSLSKLAMVFAPDDVEIAQSMAAELLLVVGNDEIDPATTATNYVVINSATKNALATMLLQQVEIMLSDVEWIISILKMDPRSRHRVKQEEQLHARLDGLVSLLSTIMSMNLPDSIGEHVLRVAGALYKDLAASARLCIAPKGVRQVLPSPGFQKLAENTCKSLTRSVYTFVAAMQRDRLDEVQPRQGKGAANKIKREGRVIPNLIYHVEDYEKHLIKLSKLTKINLMRHAKRSTARDFKIIEKAETNEEQAEDSADDEQEKDQDEENQGDGETLGKRPRDENEDGSSPKRQCKGKVSL